MPITLRILILDDSTLFSAAIKSWLNRNFKNYPNLNLEIKTVTQEDSAQVELETKQYDLFISDIQLQDRRRKYTTLTTEILGTAKKHGAKVYLLGLQQLPDFYREQYEDYYDGTIDKMNPDEFLSIIQYELNIKHKNPECGKGQKRK